MNVKIKKMHEKAVVPVKANVGDAAFDFVATEEIIDITTRTLIYKLGWAVEIPEGHVGFLLPRSSIANKDIVLSNSVGTIDSSYRGELMAKFKSVIPQKAKKYEVGDRVVQLIIMPIPQVTFEVVNELSNTARGSGGYGSTGR